MIINSNDIFTQIGFIVSPKKPDNRHNISFFENPRYLATLEIELGEDEKHLLQVKDTDEPHAVALNFCREHRLNKLAVSIVEQKIVEAKQQEEKKLAEQMKAQSKGRPDKRRGELEVSRSKSPSVTPGKKKQSMKPGDNIYLRGMIKGRLLEEDRNKRKAEMDQKEQDSLTFKPKINKVSQKIVQFMRETNMPAQKKQSPPKKMYEEMKECTFKPKINKVSERLVSNRSMLKGDREREKGLNDTVTKTVHQSHLKDESQEMFKPKINPRSSEWITMPFFQRLEVALEKRSRLSSKSIVPNEEECSFHPKVGRAPRVNRNKENVSVWEYLHKKSNNSRDKSKNRQMTNQTSTQSLHSQNYYDNLVEDRIREVFEVLDSDLDGVISPDQIAIEMLPPPSLIFLKPILLQMDEINASLNFYEFRKAVLALMVDSDPGTKGAFISQKWKKQEQQDGYFKPQINKRSRQMAYNRSFDKLYHDGLKEKQSRQFRLEKERAMKEEQELAQCSFKPSLEQSSKIFISRLGQRKGTAKSHNLSQMIDSFMKDESENHS